ncbi:hypothetical protein [Streptomyces sp. NPDC054888]
MREERKLKLKFVVTAAVRNRFRMRAAINLRLLLQTQHSPPIAGSTGPRPMRVEMPVQFRPAELGPRWSKGMTRRHYD